jgi:hypothetical protein
MPSHVGGCTRPLIALRALRMFCPRADGISDTARSLPDVQISLLGEPEPTAPEATASSAGGGRLTSKGIAPGDIVEIDRKGRRFHALVERVEQRESGRFDLSVRPLDGRSTWRSATVREIVGVWRRAKGAAGARPEEGGAGDAGDAGEDDVERLPVWGGPGVRVSRRGRTIGRAARGARRGARASMVSLGLSGLRALGVWRRRGVPRGWLSATVVGVARRTGASEVGHPGAVGGCDAVFSGGRIAA